MNTTTATKTTVRLILTGASGYLGQHLLSHWIINGVLPPSSPAADANVEFQITALYHTSESFPQAVEKFRQNHPQHPKIKDVVILSIDLTDPSDIESLLQSSNAGVHSKTTPTVVIVVHAAALSSPGACQANPESAMAINVPTKFFGALHLDTSILALSTDQVYDGRQKSGSYYKEDEKDGLNPVNVYGQTKLELEGYLSQQQQSLSSSCFGENTQSLLVALRSSIILGPKAPIDPDCSHGTFLDFCQSRGQQKESTTFFTNEYRSVVRVDRVIRTIGGLVSRIVVAPRTPLSSVVYNMGGPVRVNRMELASAVFEKFGYDRSLLVEAEQTSPTSPPDISMDSSLLCKEDILPRNEVQDPETYLKELVDYVFGVE